MPSKRAPKQRPFYKAHEGRWGRRLRGLLLDAAYLGAYAAAWAWVCGTPLLPGPWRLVATAWVAAEAAFFAYGKLRYRHFNRLRDPPPPSDASRLPALLSRFLRLRHVFDMRDFLSGWFLETPLDQIRRGNVLEFVAYGFHAKGLEELTEEEAQELDAFLSRAVDSWGMDFPDGYNPRLRFMAHAWEPLRVYHKPLAAYLAAEACGQLARWLLRGMGFKRGRHGGFTLWLHPGGGSGSGGGGVPEAAAPGGGATAPALPRAPSPLSPRSAAVHGQRHALDAAVTATAVVAAAASAQYPHAGEPQYHETYHMTFRAARAARRAERARATGGGGAAGLRRAGSAAGLGRHARVDSMASTASIDSFDLSAEPSAASLAGDPQLPQQQQRGRPSARSTAPPGGQGQQQAGGRPSPSPAAPVPIVFLHGVGFGVLPYLRLVADLQAACPGHPVMVLEVPHVALRLCWEALSADDVARAVAGALRSAGYESACIVGHSYGSFVASRLCQLHPEVVHSVALLDPVCLMTCYPQLLFNFVYKKPALAEVLASPSSLVDLARYVCSRDLTIAQAFCRKFQWTDLMLWPEDMPSRALVVLSGKDDLVPADLVEAQFRHARHAARVMHHPQLGHGGILLDAAWQAEVLAALRGMLST